jgi:hypothetical protein
MEGDNVRKVALMTVAAVLASGNVLARATTDAPTSTAPTSAPTTTPDRPKDAVD